MHTVTEIVEAVKQLPVEEKRELLEQLGPVLESAAILPAEEGDELPADFTRRLVEHFHRAKQAALRRTG